MTFPVLLAILGAALLHASWNALIRVGTSKTTTMAVMTVVQASMGALLLIGKPWPTPDVWPWLVASGAFHAGYKIFLAFAYEQGDLSRVYPIARGAAPLGVLLISLAFLNENLGSLEIAAVLVLGLGILIMGQGAFRSGESRRLIPLALCSAAMTAGYSIVDGLGARLAGDAALYVAWLFVLDAVFFTPTLILLRGSSAFRADARAWGLGSLAAAFSYGAYAIAVWAMTVAPIALVTALRETSILFAVLIGWIIFREPMDRQKGFAAGLILVGVLLTRL